ncbi:MAG: energy transducer TonB [Nitrospirota bacterium]
MKGPSFQKTTALSFVLHLTVFLIAFLILKQPNHIISLPPYTVSLVSPDVLTSINEAPDTSKESVTLPDISRKDIKKEITKKEKGMVEEKISAIATKKKIERIVRLRSIISLKAGGNKRSGNPQTTSTYTGKGILFDNYYSKITREIWQQWVFPDTGQKDIEAIISIRILKDGTITAQRIEKSSGNPLFDRSAIKAIAKASPLSPPPYEMEIGVRFFP